MVRRGQASIGGALAGQDWQKNNRSNGTENNMAKQQQAQKYQPVTADAVEVFEIPKDFPIRQLMLPIRGTSPLLISTWYAKAQDEEQRFLMSNGKDGVPASWFKRAIVSAARHLQGTTMKLVQMSVMTIGDNDGLVPLKFGKRETLSVVSRNDYSRELFEVVRPCYHDWTVDLPIEFMMDSISRDELVTLVNLAGTNVGIGTGRPEIADVKGTFMRRKRTYNSIQLKELPPVGTFALDFRRLSKSAA